MADKWNLFRGIRLRELDKKKPLASSMPGLDMRLDKAELERLVSEVRGFPGALEQAALAATETTRGFARQKIVSGLKELTTLKAAYIGKAIKSRKAKAKGEGLQAEIMVVSKRLPLSRYAVNPERPPQLKGVPVAARKRTSYRLRHAGGLSGDRPRTDSEAYSSLFVQGMKSGHIGVLYRNKNSGKIIQEYAPAVQYHMYADGFIERVVNLSHETFVVRFREAALQLRGVTP